MKIRDTRLWAAAVAIAFVVLWCVSIGTAYSSPSQELISEPVIQSTTAPQIEAIGVCGWAIVGVGALCVLWSIIAACRTPKHRRAKPRRALYGKSHRIQRRY